MTDIFSLPAEIQRQCINHLDGASLKSIRLTSLAFRDIATETLFDLVTLRVTANSADRFNALIRNADIRRCIHTLYLDSQCDKYCSYGECCSDPPSEWWEKAVAEWGSIALPNLRRLILDTTYACADSHCASLALAFAGFLSHRDVETVTIKHLQDFCRAQPPDIVQFPTIPKKLHLLITTWTDEASPDMDIELRHRHEFFNNRLNTSWLNPMRSHLTHLTLHCNTYWGVYPRWQPGDLRFPALKSLAFGKWTIAFEWQLDFITSHGQTLEQLILRDCPILHASRMTPRQTNNAWHQRLPGTSRGKPPTTNSFFDLRWHHVLADFQRKLPKLKHFAMARGPVGNCFWGEADCSADEAFDNRYGLAPRIDSSRYAIFDFGDGAMEYEVPNPEWRTIVEEPGSRWSWLERETDEDVRRKIRFPDCLQEDQEALEDLLRVLRERA